LVLMVLGEIYYSYGHVIWFSVVLFGSRNVLRLKSPDKG
jgi:hypothetical protein